VSEKTFIQEILP